MEKSWRDQFTAQFAANCAYGFLLFLLAVSGVIALWAWHSLARPEFATLVVVLIVLMFCSSCGALYLRDRAKPGDAGDDEHLKSLTEQIGTLREISATKDGIIEEWKKGSDSLAKIHEKTASDLVAARTTMQTQKFQIESRDARLDDLKPKIDWVTDLIESARGIPPFLSRLPNRWLANPVETLEKKEPWFEFVIAFEYTGVHRLIIGEKVKGFLARWGGDQYNYDPILKLDRDEEPPFNAIGPTGGRLKIKQRVTSETAIELRDVVIKGADPESRRGAINIVTKDFYVSVRVLTVFDEEIYRGQLFGEDIEVRYTLEG